MKRRDVFTAHEPPPHGWPRLRAGFDLRAVGLRPVGLRPPAPRPGGGFGTGAAYRCCENATRGPYVRAPRG
jgi:hypothetical protein